MGGFRDFIEQKGSTALIGFFIIQLVIYLATLTVCIIYEKDENDDVLRDSIFKWGVLTELYSVQVYYTYHAVYKQNVIELFALNVIALLTTFCGGNRFLSIAFSTNTNKFTEIMCYIQTSSSVLLNIFFIVASYYLWDIFKWQIYKKIGGNDQVRMLFKNYETFKALLKLYFLVCLTILASYLVFIKGYPSFIYIGLDLLGFILNGLVFYFGYTGVRKENAKWLNIYLILIITLFTFTIVSFALLYIHPPFLSHEIIKLSWDSQVIVGLIITCYVGIFIFLMVYSRKAQKSIGQGLKELLDIHRKSKIQNKLIEDDDDDDQTENQSDIEQ